MVDLNADIGDILKGLFGKKNSADGNNGSGNTGNKVDAKYYKGVIIASFLYISMTILLIYAIYSYVYSDYVTNKEDLEKRTFMAENITKMKQKTESLNKNMVNSYSEYQEILDDFGNTADIQELYRTISNIAVRYNLVVLNVRREKEKINAADRYKAKKANKGKEETKEELVKEVHVFFNLEGSFGSYISFKERLYRELPIINIKDEKISIVDDKEKGSIVSIELLLTAFTVDKTPFLVHFKELEKRAKATNTTIAPNTEKN